MAIFTYHSTLIPNMNNHNPGRELLWIGFEPELNFNVASIHIRSCKCWMIQLLRILLNLQEIPRNHATTDYDSLSQVRQLSSHRLGNLKWQFQFFLKHLHKELHLVMYKIAPFSEPSRQEKERGNVEISLGKWHKMKKKISYYHCNNWCTFSLTSRGSLQI